MRCKPALAALAALVASAGLFGAAGSASAGLGRAYASVDADRAVLGAAVVSTVAGPYTVHTLTLQNQGTVREYTRPDGLVFAVTWRGPGRPNLRQILGDSFDAVQADNAQRGGARIRHPLMVNRANLQVQTGGHPGAFWGVALLPALQPAGFALANLK